MNFLLVGVGGALGAIIRYALTLLFPYSPGTGFPWAILISNVIGAGAIGFLSVILLYRFESSELLRLFLMVGLLGGFTTFSSFTLDTLYFLQNAYWLKAMANIIVSIVVCLIACYLGIKIADTLV